MMESIVQVSIILNGNVFDYVDTFRMYLDERYLALININTLTYSTFKIIFSIRISNLNIDTFAYFKT